MRPKIKAFISAFITPLQALELAWRQLRDERGIDNAVGVQLDNIGKLVGQKRAGQDDATYRRYIRARITVNRSNGVTSDMIKIARLILGVTTGKVLIRTRSNATFIVELQDIPVLDAATATALQSMLVAAVGGGVRVVIIYGSRPLSQTFRLDSGPGLDVGHLDRGIDDTGTP